MTNQEKSKVTLFNYGNNDEGIGFNFFAIEITKPNGEKQSIAIDGGNKFPPDYLKGINNLVLDVSPFLEKADALLLSHGHMDHITSPAHMRRLGDKVPPVYGTVYTLGNFESMLARMGVEHHDFPKVNIIGANPSQKFSKTIIGDFEIAAYPSSHSIPGALSFFVKVNRQKYGDKDLHLYFSGDGRLNPCHVGYETDLEALRERFEQGIDFMFLDSTSVVSEENPIKEAEIAQETAIILKEQRGKQIIMSAISNNIPRLQTLMIGAGLAGYKNINIKGFSAVQAWKNLLIAAQHDPQYDVVARVNKTLKQLGCTNEIRVPLGRDTEFNPNDSIIFTTGVNGEEHSALDRAANGEHPDINIDENTFVYLSQRVIPVPGAQELRNYLIKRLEGYGAEVLEGPHCSGHASKPETKKLINTSLRNVPFNSFYGVPIHGNKNHLKATENLFEEMGIKPFMMKSGDIVLLGERPQIIGNKELSIYAIQSEQLAKNEVQDIYYPTNIIDGKISADRNNPIWVMESPMLPYHPSEVLTRLSSGARAKMTRDENLAIKKTREEAKEKAKQEANNKRTTRIDYTEQKQAISKAQSAVKKAEKKEALLRKDAKKAEAAHKKSLAKLRNNIEIIQDECSILANAKEVNETALAEAKKHLDDAKQILKDAENKTLGAVEKYNQATTEKQAAKARLNELQLKKDEEVVSYTPGVIPQQVAAQQKRQAQAQTEHEKRMQRRKQEEERITKRAQKRRAEKEEHQKAIQEEKNKKQAEKDAKAKAKLDRFEDTTKENNENAIAIMRQAQKEATQEVITIRKEIARKENLQEIKELQELEKIAIQELKDVNNILTLVIKKTRKRNNANITSGSLKIKTSKCMEKQK